MLERRSLESFPRNVAPWQCSWERPLLGNVGVAHVPFPIGWVLQAALYLARSRARSNDWLGVPRTPPLMHVPGSVGLTCDIKGATKAKALLFEASNA